MAIIDRKFDRKIFIMRSLSRSGFLKINRDRCRDLGKAVKQSPGQAIAKVTTPNKGLSVQA
jgi:hypothetical protein